MRIAHPSSTGLVASGAYKIYGITVTASATADASITIVNSATGSGSPETVDTVKAKQGEATVQVTYQHGIDVGVGIYVSAISGATGATFGIQYDG